MRRLRTTVLAIVPGLVVAMAGVLSPGMARAAFAGYAASDVLGQLDGNGNADYTTNTSGTTETKFTDPQGQSTLDFVHHRLFVPASSDDRVLVFNLDTNNNLIDHTADYVLGQPDFTSNASSDNTPNGMDYPYGTVYDAVHNRLFVSNYGARVLVFDLSGGITNGMNASYVLGQPDLTTGNFDPAAQNTLGGPAGLVYDAASGNLFVADSQYNRVMVFNIAGGITNGMNASYVLGQPDFTSSAANTTQSGMDEPIGISYDSAHHWLFVPGYNNNRVTVFDLSSGISNGVNASYVLGAPDFTNPGTGPTQNLVNNVYATAYDAGSEQLFVADDSDNRILIFDLSNGISNGMNASGVIGQVDFTSSVGATSQRNFNGPRTIAYDPSTSKLYVGDDSNNRVMIFDIAKLAPSLNDPAVGDKYSQWMGSQFQGTPAFSVISGSLPPGLTLDPSSGLLGGTFTQAGTFNFTIQLADDLGTAGTVYDRQSYTLVVDPAAVAGARTLTNTGLNIGLGSGLGIALIGTATFVYRKRNHLYRLRGWER